MTPAQSHRRQQRAFAGLYFGTVLLVILLWIMGRGGR
jgi:high-affinity Fe2+/Pb2+ permease